MTNDEILKAHQARQGKEDTKDETSEPRSRKTPLPQEKVLNLPRKIMIGEMSLRLKAFSLSEGAAVQDALWSQAPPIVLAAALSRGKGIDVAEAQILFGQMDTQCEGLDEHQVQDRFQKVWRALSISASALTPLFASALTVLAVDEQDAPLSADAIAQVLEERRLALVDAVELLQAIFDICGGFPGDIRERF